MRMVRLTARLGIVEKSLFWDVAPEFSLLNGKCLCLYVRMVATAKSPFLVSDHIPSRCHNLPDKSLYLHLRRDVDTHLQSFIIGQGQIDETTLRSSHEVE